MSAAAPPAGLPGAPPLPPQGAPPAASAPGAAATTKQQGKVAKPGKKPRKAYTITKPRESWTDIEHQKFVESLKVHGRDWKRIEEHVGTKSVIQIRSHAQKYFIKLQKTGKAHEIPPPREKKRSKRPDPKPRRKPKKQRKTDERSPRDVAASSAAAAAAVVAAAAAAASLASAQGGRGRGRGHHRRKSSADDDDDSGDEDDDEDDDGDDDDDDSMGGDSDGYRYGERGMRRLRGVPPPIHVGDSSLESLVSVPLQLPMPPSLTPAAQWRAVERKQLEELQTRQMSRAQFELMQEVSGYAGARAKDLSAKGADGMPGGGGAAEPDFSRVYSFLGSLFDPSTRGDHEKELQEMNVVDREIVQILMRNLTTNLMEAQSKQRHKVEQQQQLEQMSRMRAPFMVSSPKGGGGGGGGSGGDSSSGGGGGGPSGLTVNVGSSSFGSAPIMVSPLAVSGPAASSSASSSSTARLRHGGGVKSPR